MSTKMTNPKEKVNFLENLTKTQMMQSFKVTNLKSDLENDNMYEEGVFHVVGYEQGMFSNL